ncbi:MAG: UDP-GlcNAc--UDP-phosphate GlcNAc-1-phosphate transferase [Muribaculaceae bacterium]|nr:UDP-GlcNAc--UDP-phosphate GlcNAc-1-phosphate transferase [Muribaculaceae bacterium]
MIFAIIFILLLLLEVAYFGVAKRFNIVDYPVGRSSHATATLRGGGIVILFGAWLYAAFFGSDYCWFLLGLTLVGTVSFIDDLRPQSIALRLVAQSIGMSLLLYQLEAFITIPCWILLIALIIGVGILNAFNFMDGINGITGSYSLAVIAPLVYLNISDNFIPMPYLYVTALSLIVFCLFNFRNRALCFVGDVGSISIAFILVFAIGLLMLHTGNYSYIVFIAVYGVDSVMTIIHRIMLHENIGQPHRKHAYQLMANELKINHLHISLMYMVLQLAISFGLIFSNINPYLYLGITIILLSLAYILFMKKYYHLHNEYP